MLAYDFGPWHPLRPERLRRAVELLERYAPGLCIDPGPGSREDALRVHSEEYVAAVERLSRGESSSEDWAFGFGSGDNPPFPGMFEASQAYLAGSIEAAKAVRDGAPLAFNLSGGLHHAHRSQASGFCIFDDPAAAVHVLLERFERVAYVDIDVHHGDGVQGIWLDDPRVLTCSIHESGRTLFPGTGFVEETGGCFTSLNVPMEAGTTGDVWLWAFESAVLPALERFRPQAIVLQIGTDAHFLDPLAHLRVAAQDWLTAVRRIGELGIPLVAVGGGGYEITCVPRMWTAAVLTLSAVEFEDRIPEDLAEAWGMPAFFDPHPPGPAGSGRGEAERAIAWLRTNLLPKIPPP
jgi:acetoin utilization protein AcuC